MNSLPTGESAERMAVRRALDALKPYLSAFVAQQTFITATPHREPDIATLLKEILQGWDKTFSRTLPPVARSYVHELLDVRNRWAHEQRFSVDEATRGADTARQLARLIGAPEPRHAAPARVSTTLARSSSSSGRVPTQRAVMREIYLRVGGDQSRAIAEYAAAERSGAVGRKRNRAGLDPEGYAAALLADGLTKGWLK